MRMDRKKRLLYLVWISAGLLAMTGCQSCQGGGDAPPAAEPTPVPPTAAAEAAQPAASPARVQPQPQAPEEEVDDDALVLLAEGEPDWGDAPLTVEFLVESMMYDEMKSPKYSWDFGDGGTSSEASPTHTYEKPGTYTATIRIVDADGLLGWDEVEIEVEEPE